MTQSKLLFGIVLLSVLSLMGCPPSREIKPDSTIVMVNKTNKDILFNFSPKPYPDTTLFEGDSPFSDIQQFNLSLIYANNSRSMIGDWIAGFEKDPRPIMLFFFSRDTIDQVPWEKVTSEYNILKRYDLSKSTLDSLNWTIEYK
ncbi:MAG: hypothetical protein NW218_13770 [Saprospiraceae bacterium]|nr:hypothetical protein [Saprospiraceae bacterium]